MLLTLKQLLASIVDYAGLFPPAQLSLPDAIASYDRAQSSPYQWLVGRFVLPATRLPEFVTLLERRQSAAWSLSVILSQNWAAELEQIRQNAAMAQNLICAVEVSPLPPDQIQAVVFHVSEGITAFFEIPWDADLEPYLAMLRQVGAAAKLRTGGITGDAFPDSALLARRIVSLAKAQIPFKATAGLHHPLRGSHRLTDEPDGASTPMHGFLNVALLAAVAFQQCITFDDAIALLEEHSLNSFQFTETAIHWRDYSLSLSALERSRWQFFHSFGSCSVEEPIDDLHTLKLL